LLWASLGTGAVVTAAVLLALPRVRALGAGFHHHTYLLASIAWGALVPALAAAVALVRVPRARTVTLTLLVAVDSLALFVLPELAAPRAVTIDTRPVAYLRRHLGDSRFFTMGPIQPNYGSYFALATLDINDFPPQAYADYVHTRLDGVVNPTLFVGNFGGWRPLGQPSPEQELLRHLDGYRATGVRYVLTPAGSALPQSPRTFSLVFRSPTTWIYRLAGASSYFTAPGCRITSASRQSALLSCRRSSTLVRRETWFPGWSAQLDGRPVAIRRRDGLFQALTVPAGTHRVSFSFAPPGIEWGLLGLLGGCMLLCAPMLPRWRSTMGEQF
jgi:hypothetical protein